MTSTAKAFIDGPLLVKQLTVGMIIEYENEHSSIPPYVVQVIQIDRTGDMLTVRYRFLPPSGEQDYLGTWAPDDIFITSNYTIRPHIIEELPV